MIKVVNMKNYRKETGWELVKVDRSSVLGNPFRMRQNDHHERRRVCDEYEKMFYYILSHPNVETVEPVPDYRINCRAFRNEVEQLAIAVYEGHDIALGCWCFPLKCHALTIASYVRNRATELEFNDPPMPDEPIDQNEVPFDTTNSKEFVPGTSQDAVNEAKNSLHRLPTQIEMQNVVF